MKRIAQGELTMGVIIPALCAALMRYSVWVHTRPLHSVQKLVIIHDRSSFVQIPLKQGFSVSFNPLLYGKTQGHTIGLNYPLF